MCPFILSFSSHTVTPVIIGESRVAQVICSLLGDQAAAYTCVLSINKHCLLSSAISDKYI